jgi:hypothetical protein
LLVIIYGKVGRSFIFWAKYALVCMLVFGLYRSVFLAVQHTSVRPNVWDWLAVWLHAVRLDMAMVGYCIWLPSVVVLFIGWTGAKQLKHVLWGIVCVQFVLYGVAALSEAGVYQEWNTKLNIEAIKHLGHPVEVVRTVSYTNWILFWSCLVVITWGAMRLVNRWAMPHIVGQKQSKWSLLGQWILVVGGAIIMARGGLQPIPIQESDAYFSSRRLLNDAAVNTLWALGHTLMEYRTFGRVNPYQTMPPAEANQIVQAMYQVPVDTTIQVLTSSRPNIVFILLESWSAQVVHTFGGDPFSPFVDSLASTGIAFTQTYANAHVSDQGIPAVLSGYPCVPRVSVTNDPSKSKELGCINQSLDTLGYTSGFLFGGDLNYGNIKSYLYNKGFEHIVEERHLAHAHLAHGRLGYHDKDMAKVLLDSLHKTPQPFVYVWFTTSTHSPYDIPEAPSLPPTPKENPYIQSVAYSDEALRQFFKLARQTSWYNNTLFVLVADHSHVSHKEYAPHESIFHRIPFLLAGNVIRPEWRGKQIHTICSQTDIVPTILKQLQLTTEKYPFGRNLFNPYSPTFALSAHHDGFILTTDSCTISRARWMTTHPIVSKTYPTYPIDTARYVHQFNALRQYFYQDFLNR